VAPTVICVSRLVALLLSIRRDRSHRPQYAYVIRRISLSHRSIHCEETYPINEFLAQQKVF
jgi:hypothetical protein